MNARTSAESVILMALCNKSFLHALVTVPTFVDMLEDLGMVFLDTEKTLLQGLSAERLAPYQHSFAEVLKGKERRVYKARAKSLLDQHAYALAPRPELGEPELPEALRQLLGVAESAPDPTRVQPKRETTLGIRPDRENRSSVVAHNAQFDLNLARHQVLGGGGDRRR